MKTIIKKLSGSAFTKSVLKKVGDEVNAGDQIMVITSREQECICTAEISGVIAHIAAQDQNLTNGTVLFIVADEFTESYTDEMPEYPVANSITVIRNESSQRIVITKPGEKTWFIEKNARIAVDAIPLWVRQHKDFIEFQHEKMLVYDVLSAAKEMIHN